MSIASMSLLRYHLIENLSQHSLIPLLIRIVDDVAADGRDPA